MSDDPQAVIDETIEFIAVRRDRNGNGDGRLTGDTPDWFGDRLFGGFVVAQAIHAAVTHVASRDKRIHSLHGYFLRPVLAGKPVTYDVTALKDGRTFGVHRLDAVQDGATAFTMTCSFTSDVTGDDRPVYEYETADGAAPDGCPRPGDDGLDHAVWFHRPARADQWLFFDVHSLVNTGGRGVLRGTLRDLQGKLVASLAQEMLLIPPSD